MGNHFKLIRASRITKTSIKMHFLQILLLTAMVAIAMEKCVAKYLLVEMEDEIAERQDSMFNARASNDCSWSKWGECSESCGYGFMERVRINTAGKSGKENCVGLPKERKSCQVRKNNCEDSDFKYKSDYACPYGNSISLKDFSTLREAQNYCNAHSNCNCVDFYHSDSIYRTYTVDTQAWNPAYDSWL